LTSNNNFIILNTDSTKTYKLKGLAAFHAPMCGRLCRRCRSNLIWTHSV